VIENPTALNNVVTTRTTIFSRRRKRILIVDTTFVLVGLGHSYLTVLFSPGNGNARTFITNRVRAFGPKHFRKVHASRVCVCVCSTPGRCRPITGYRSTRNAHCGGGGGDRSLPDWVTATGCHGPERFARIKSSPRSRTGLWTCATFAPRRSRG